MSEMGNNIGRNDAPAGIADEATLQQRAPETSAEIFRRMAGRVRLFGAGAVLAGEVGALGLLAITWYTNAHDTMPFQPSSEGLVGLAAGSVVVVQVLMRGARLRPLLSVGLGAIASVGFLLLYWLARDWTEPQLNAPTAAWILGAIMAGALLGHGLFIAARAICTSATPAGELARSLPDLGREPDGLGYRAEAEAFLNDVEGAFVRAIRCARIVGLALLGLLVFLIAWEWERGRSEPAQWTVWENGEAIGWLVLGAFAGAAAATALLPTRMRRVIVIVPAAVVLLVVLGATVGLAVDGELRLLGHAAPAVGGIALSTASIALVACLVVRFVVSFLLRWLLPRPIALHLLGTDSGANPPAAPPGGALACEMCGYRLEGLPPATCATCGTSELRCPECGHQQPSATLHARLLLRLCTAHTILRVLAWLGGIGAGLILLLPWFPAGMAWSSGSLFRGADIAGVAAVCFCVIAPLRVLLMSRRPIILTSLLVAALPLLVLFLGAWTSVRGAGPLRDVFILGAIWLTSSLIVPPLWRLWLWVMYGSASRAAWSWHTSRAFRRGGSERMLLEASLTGSDWLAGRPLSACAGCGVLHASPDGTAVSLARIMIEALVGRAQQMMLVLAAVALAITCAIPLLMLASWGSQYADIGPTILVRGDIATMALAAAAAGTAWRMATIHRRALPAVLCAALPPLAAFLLPLATSDHHVGRPGLTVAICALIAMAAIVGAALSVPALTVLARLSLSRPYAKLLLPLFRGKKAS